MSPLWLHKKIQKEKQLASCKGFFIIIIFYFLQKLHYLQPWKQKSCAFCENVKLRRKQLQLFLNVYLAIINVNIVGNMLRTMIKYFGN